MKRMSPDPDLTDVMLENLNGETLTLETVKDSLTASGVDSVVRWKTSAYTAPLVFFGSQIPWARSALPHHERAQ